MDVMQPKRTPLFVPVLWFFVSIIWAYTFGMSLSTGRAGFGMLALQAVTVIVSFAAGVLNTRRYLKNRKKK